MSPTSIREGGAGALFVVSAPSGTGKSTLIGRLMESVGGLQFGVSHTTRPQRPGEREGVDYHFVDAAGFSEIRDAEELLEWAEVHGQLYGTARSSVETIHAAGHDALLDLDVQGAEAVRRLHPGAVLVFVLPPDFSELCRRLKARGTAAAEVARRLDTAREEILHAEHFDYLVTNESLEEAGTLLEAIVLAERCRRGRRLDELRRVTGTFSNMG